MPLSEEVGEFGGLAVVDEADFSAFDDPVGGAILEAFGEGPIHEDVLDGATGDGSDLDGEFR